MLASTATIELDDLNNMQYFGDLYMGSNKQKVTFMFDTGSAPLWVYSKPKCGETSRCPADLATYDETTSTDYEDKKTRSFASYALGLVNGEISADTLCLSQTNCVGSKLQYLLVDEGSNMETYVTSGFVGLAPRNIRNDMPSFME